MIIDRVLNAIQNAATPPATPLAPAILQPELLNSYGSTTVSGQAVSPELAKTLASAYRCGNIISDDIASMPFQMFQRTGRSTEKIVADGITRNMAYLLEVQPNRWMTPFVWKKTIALWLIYYGNAYIWQPVQEYHELFILGANRTWPQFDKEGNLWYRSYFPSGKWADIPAVEVTHLMINSVNGLVGRSVISYARETIGRQLGAHETQNRLNGSGLNPSAILWVNGEVNKEARDKIRETYTDAVTGSANAGKAAIFDAKVAKFEPITMKPSDAQFLESMQATDAEVANFFGLPLYKLNMGKQSYESNSAQQLDYLATTLNPYLVQWEQAARMKWLPQELQDTVYFRFIREALLQTDAETRSKYLKEQIMSGQMTPNEARQVNDMSAYEGGDQHYIPANMAPILEDGTLAAITQGGSADNPTEEVDQEAL